MKIIEKLKNKQSDLSRYAPATIAFLGDSVTQGCFGCTMSGTRIVTETDYEASIARKLEKMLHVLYPTVQLNMINSGIGGDSAPGGLARFERDIARYAPDLVIVGYGLNDSGAGLAGVGVYRDALREIFLRAKAIPAEVIFLTPNMMNTAVSHRLTDEFLIRLAGEFAERQRGGVLDAYVAAAKEVAAECGVAVCDIYAMWQTLDRAGVATTELLANALNHPIRELNTVTAYELLRLMLA